MCNLSPVFVSACAYKDCMFRRVTGFWAVDTLGVSRPVLSERFRDLRVPALCNKKLIPDLIMNLSQDVRYQSLNPRCFGYVCPPFLPDFHPFFASFLATYKFSASASFVFIFFLSSACRLVSGVPASKMVTMSGFVLQQLVMRRAICLCTLFNVCLFFAVFSASSAHTGVA